MKREKRDVRENERVWEKRKEVKKGRIILCKGWRNQKLIGWDMRCWMKKYSIKMWDWKEKVKYEEGKSCEWKRKKGVKREKGSCVVKRKVERKKRERKRWKKELK